MNDDTAELLLAARKYLGIDVPFAVEQIEARRRLKGKLPEWYGNADLIMGGRVPAEQCSSEQTARYKRSIIEGQSLCDMTGGMGVDFWYMSEGMERAIYTERSEWLCEVAKHNFQMLQTLPSQQTLPSPSLQGGGSISANRGGNGETDEQGNHSLPVGRVRGGSEGSAAWTHLQVGDTVTHKSFGKGVVKSIDERFIIVAFAHKESRFPYPWVFEQGYMSV